MVEINRPPVTILMPVFNAEKYLKNSMESILAQTYDNFEFLIINDGSTDNSSEIIRSYDDPRIRYVENEINIGMIPTLNKGLGLASHDLVARQDADDISHTRRLELETEFMMQNENIVLLGARADDINDQGRPLASHGLQKPLGAIGIKWFLFFDNAFIHSSVIFRNKIIDGMFGGYQWSDWAGDYELWSRVALECPVANLPDHLVEYRVHPGSLIGSLAGDEKKESVSSGENISIIKTNLDKAFGKDSFSIGDAKTLRLFIDGVDESSVDRYIVTFEKVLATYRKKYPECEGSRDFKATVAAQYALTAYCILHTRRSTAFRLYWKAIALHPAVIARIPLGRALVLTLFGESGRSVYRNFKSLIFK